MVRGGVIRESVQIEDVALRGHRVAQALLPCAWNHHRGLHGHVCQKLSMVLRSGGHRPGGKALLFLLFQERLTED